METISTEVVVVGAGPSGAAAAWRLAQAGLKVVSIERGDWFAYDEVRRDQPDYELRRAGPLHANPNIRRGRDDAPVDDVDSPIKPMIGNAVGGGSIYWSAHVPRFRPEDFRIATLDGIGSDWPISYDDLAPYYEENEKRLGTAFVPGDPSAPPRGEHGLTLPTIGAHGRRFGKAFDRLGWHWWPVDLVVGREADDPATVHCTHAGPCDLGCPSRIRSGADQAYMHDAIANGVRLLTRTRVMRLEHDADGRVTAALCMTDEGPLRVEGRIFVLAANGMGTPHLLLLSRSERFPDGLGNDSGLVGRNLMLHPYARVDGLFPEAMGAWAAGEKAGIVSFEFYATRPERDFVRGLKLQLTGGPAPVALACGAGAGSMLPWGEAHHAAFEERFDRICGLTVCAEDLAEDRNRITLSETLVDRDGTPAPKMIYTLSDNSRRILDFGMDRAEEVLREAGATAIDRTPLRAEAGFHLMGTARMGQDPARSVVDPFGRCHGVPNLYITDASVFVTSAAINPTATAQALALRTADSIAATFLQ
ncbi:GMC family oxidoreductase [Microvirga sp. BT689]|uniref:GMC family oxidoreductase n=1 Tax=Microvirga arvi TaxID=2778731 RepID=UPI00194F8A26|nr:GMC family oxidoreductase [Microvirga arvi]MBM6581865.1 GMC family oxidoreductase [Microvirga arvi]